MIPKDVDKVITDRFINESQTYKNDDIFMADLFSAIFESAAKETIKDYKCKPVEDALYAAFKSGHEIWREVAHFVNNSYNQDFSDMGFLLAMESFFGTQQDQAGHNALVKYIENELGAQFFDQDESFTMDPKTVESYIDKSDPNLLHQFFMAFQDLGDFKRKPDEYDNPDDYNKYMKLMALYTKLMQR